MTSTCPPINTKPARRLLVVSGEHSWCQQQALELVAPLDKHLVFTLDNAADHNKRALGLLGMDSQVVIYDAFTGLDPNAFAAVCGTIVVGGAMILLCPELDEWVDYADPFNAKLIPYPLSEVSVTGHYLARWARLIRSTKEIEIISQGSGAHYSPLKPHENEDHELDLSLTEDQAKAVDAVIKVITGQRKRPAVLVADRGRGKSAALGIGVANLVQKGLVQNVAIVGGQAQSLDTVFKHLNAVFVLPNTGANTVAFDTTRISKVTIDEAIANAGEYDLIAVDEAASIGLPRLEKLLKVHSRLAFATTVQGYEGSGRGFHLKFKNTLKRFCRGPQFCELDQPIRWAHDDPLERVSDQLLLLSAKVFPLGKILLDQVIVKELSPKNLIEDEALVEQVMGLLVSAHYQTRPVDLRYLLDAPNHRLLGQFVENKVCGVVWICQEGGLDRTMAEAVCFGKRRPKGHLVPEILAAHLGLAEGAQCLTARIQRIAIHPDYQGKGLGSSLLTEVEGLLKDEVDLFASSFGAEARLLNFWNQMGYRIVRISDTANAASGQHSALVLKAASSSGAGILASSQSVFQHQLVAQLSESLGELDWSILRELFLHTPKSKESDCLSNQHHKDLIYFADGHRPYESTVGALQRFCGQIIAESETFKQLDETQQKALVYKALQQFSWEKVAVELGLSGRKEVEKALRQAVKKGLAMPLEKTPK